MLFGSLDEPHRIAWLCNLASASETFLLVRMSKRRQSSIHQFVSADKYFMSSACCRIEARNADRFCCRFSQDNFVFSLDAKIRYYVIGPIKADHCG